LFSHNAIAIVDKAQQQAARGKFKEVYESRREEHTQPIQTYRHK